MQYQLEVPISMNHSTPINRCWLLQLPGNGSSLLFREAGLHLTAEELVEDAADISHVKWIEYEWMCYTLIAMYNILIPFFCFLFSVAFRITVVCVPILSGGSFECDTRKVDF